MRTKEDGLTVNQRYYRAHRERLLAENKLYFQATKEITKAKRKVRLKDYYEANRQKSLLYAKEYRETHVEGRKEYMTEWYQENKEQQLDYQKERNKDPEVKKRKSINERNRRYNPEKRDHTLLLGRICEQNRRVGLKTLTKETVQQVYEENIQKFGTLTCELCFKPVKFGEDALEHFHPVSRRDEYEGDINERKNLGVAHGNTSEQSCNLRKRAKTLEEWFEVQNVS